MRINGARLEERQWNWREDGCEGQGRNGNSVRATLLPLLQPIHHTSTWCYLLSHSHRCLQVGRTALAHLDSFSSGPTAFALLLSFLSTAPTETLLKKKPDYISTTAQLPTVAFKAWQDLVPYWLGDIGSALSQFALRSSSQDLATPGVLPGPAASAPTGNSLEMPCLGLHPRPTESESAF